MERTQIFDLMSDSKLNGMKTAYDEIMATGIKRQYEPPHIVGDLLQAEVSEKQARSIKYQISITKLPWRRISTTSSSPEHRLTSASCAISPKATFSSSSATASWSAATGTGKTHVASPSLAIAFAPQTRCFYNTVDLVNRLETEAARRRQGRIAEYLIRKDFVVLDELGYLPFAQTVVSCCSI